MICKTNKKSMKMKNIILLGGTNSEIDMFTKKIMRTNQNEKIKK